MKKNRIVPKISMVTLLYALVPGHSQAEITIITPPGLEDVEAGSSDTLNPGGFRSQELRPAAWFRDSLPEGGAWLVGLRDRADASQQQNVTVRYNDMKITASTTQRETISTIFADNVGNDAVEVLNGPLTLTYEVGANAPNPFSGMWEFTTPFFYNPDEGNLLLDYVSHSGLDRIFTTDSAVLAPPQVNVGSPNAQSAQSLLANLIVTQLVFQVPELEGDYNVDGVVDAADYVVWRNDDGTQTGYDTWRAHFGQFIGNGTLSNATVPEPASIALLLAGIFTTCAAPWQLDRSARRLACSI